MAETSWRGDASWGGRLSWRAWLAAGLAALVIAVVLLARLGGAPDSGEAGDRAATARPGNDGVAGETASSAAPPPPAIRAATSFMQAWLRHPPGQSPQQWWEGVSTYAEPGFARQLRLTDPERVPGRVLRGEPTPAAVSPNHVVFGFDTDAGAVLVTCVRLGAQGGAAPQVWKVSDIEPVLQGSGTDAAG